MTEPAAALGDRPRRRGQRAVPAATSTSAGSPIERLQAEDLGPGVLVEELHYGAVAVAQRLEDLRPDALVLVSAVRRGRPPGTVERRRLDPPRLRPGGRAGGGRRRRHRLRPPGPDRRDRDGSGCSSRAHGRG
ncbi:MAG: hypothetical protein WKF73_17155 [Nocardioidaceae bacterium]